MRFTKFKIVNFRGIRTATLDLTRAPPHAVNVLVGLNESGKTTVLEAINHFRSNPDLKRKDPNLRNRSDAEYQAMLPIGERALFNGQVRIISSVSLDENDAEKLDNFLKTTFNFVETKFERSFTIDQNIFFESSQKKRIHNTWSLHFYGRKKKGKTAFKQLENDDWQKAMLFLEKLLPKVMYFPSALLEFPDRIELEAKLSTKETSSKAAPSKNSFYFEVLNDVLKAIDPKLDIDKHLIERVKSSSAIDKQNLEALVQKVENHLNGTILGGWKDILGTTLGNKKFRFFINQNADGLLYAEIKLFDGNSLFSLKERSAGFRWFFAFIMLVTYRVHRNDRVLFLFDEPAANLHPRAQVKLLSSFENLSKSHQFLFTTHSHYLVNPMWLESTFIVKNEALDIENDVLDADPVTSNISITPYRTFVGGHADQHFYYKPVMDALEYSPAQISPENASILIEGKTDFYCIEYIKSTYFPDDFKLTLYPGGGSGALDSLISLLSGWASNFIVLLDGDESGAKEKNRYEEKFESLVTNRITTLAEVLGSSAPICIEKVFAESDIELIRLEIFPEQLKLTKKLLHKAIQELLATKKRLALSEETLTNFKTMLTALTNQHKVLKTA